ncbi:MAG: NUDIX domain-containing protein [Microgenomates group bacterium]
MPQHFFCPHALIRKDGKYLVMHRSANTGYKPGFWDIPGGHFNEGEDNIAEVVMRETLEETGLHIAVGKVVHISSEIQSPQRHQFCGIYECEPLAGEEINLDPVEHDEYRWVTPQEMAELPIMFFVQSLLENYLLKSQI